MYLSLREEGEGTEGPDMEAGTEEGVNESYMTMAQSTVTNCHQVDASIQKNISFDGKPMTPTGWNGGFGEIFSLRDQLKQAEERASQVQREVRSGPSWLLTAHSNVKIIFGGQNECIYQNALHTLTECNK